MIVTVFPGYLERDLNNYDAMNVVYAEYFEDDPPARAVVEAARIPRDALVEIMMVAQQP